MLNNLDLGKQYMDQLIIPKASLKIIHFIENVIDECPYILKNCYESF